MRVTSLAEGAALSADIDTYLRGIVAIDSYQVVLPVDGRYIYTMAELKRYTYADVAIRNGTKGQPIWMVYKDVVYDFTSYKDEHPGGYDTLMEGAGIDATSAFDDAGHSSDAYKQLEPYKIGVIVDEEKKYDANGKKIKKQKVVAVQPEKQNTSRSCMNLITCGLIG
ncbi:cytochrome b5-like isoform X1 [Trichoplusia ni]|uniref:Cytochrome b5-like isoform X1 n=2 Tax=Trichoplusia ni TaxID=7111 RepID=A0A7E5W780_TRINI|nr:cytochrome b5-like isoform X1 [Trichoplusia ni]